MRCLPLILCVAIAGCSASQSAQPEPIKVEIPKFPRLVPGSSGIIAGTALADIYDTDGEKATTGWPWADEGTALVVMQDEDFRVEKPNRLVKVKAEACRHPAGVYWVERRYILITSTPKD